MLHPVLKNFTVTPGVAFVYTLQYLNGVPGTAAAVPLTGASASMPLTTWNGTTTYLTLNSGGSTSASGIFFGGVTNNPLDGIITLSIVAADTSAFTFKYARYGLTLTTGTFGQQLLLYGQFTSIGFLP